MTRSISLGLALSAALIALPVCANAESNALGTGQVCGRVDAPADKIIALELAPLPGNIIVARSATEVVTTSVAPNGNFCFPSLHTDLHTLSAFGDSASYQASVLPIAGQERFIEVTRSSGW
jgi:hypothetical protein